MKKAITNSVILSLLSVISFAQIAEKAEDISPLLVGETLPNETIFNAQNQPTELLSVLKEKPTVLVFYRGGWCPYCNTQLSALAQSEADILKLGYQIVAISPDDYQNLAPTIANDKINYRLFSDPQGNLLKKTGIAFRIPEASKKNIAAKTKGEVSEVLPVPTVMVVNTKGEIVFEYISPNYRKRLTTKLLMAVLNGLEI